MIFLDILSKHFAGYLLKTKLDFADYGVWGLVAVQTRWQQQSKRSDLAIWRIPNTFLTVLPYILYKSKNELRGRCPLRILDGVHQLKRPGLIHLCQSWSYFFEEMTDVQNRYREFMRRPNFLLNKSLGSLAFAKYAQHVYWKVHIEILHFVMNNYEEKFKAFEIYPDEMRFWSKYVRLVDVYSKLDGSTTDVLLPLFKKIMPHCSPLSSELCPVNSLSLTEQIFINAPFP